MDYFIILKVILALYSFLFVISVKTGLVFPLVLILIVSFLDRLGILTNHLIKGSMGYYIFWILFSLSFIPFIRNIFRIIKGIFIKIKNIFIS